MQLEQIHSVYFLGIGGIGMSAIARYFKLLGKNVSGYDLNSTVLTSQLQSEDIEIHFSDDIKNIPDKYRIENIDNVLVVVTPAIPEDNLELNYFIQNNFKILKRAQVLGLITHSVPTIAISGTHGKTTTSTITSHIFHQSLLKTCAFLGGISKNYQTNFVVPAKQSSSKGTTGLITDSDYVIVEADEYDRSFLNLEPQIAVVTSADADHLDIYGDQKHVKEAFNLFVRKIKKDGQLIINKNVEIGQLPEHIKIYTYSIDKQSDFFCENIRLENGFYTVDIVTPSHTIINITIGVPGILNVENTVAAVAIAWCLHIPDDVIISSLATFKGVNRRFDIQYNKNGVIYIDDYAHHPKEIEAFVSSVKKVFPEKKITGVFQPHLFSRTKDFAFDFAASLSLLDQLILLEIYPAREKPISGVTSKMIFDNVKIEKKVLIQKSELIDNIAKNEIEILLTMGAGDIDKFVQQIVDKLSV